MDFKYKGYKIGKLSRSVFSSGGDGFVWNVFKDGKNTYFSTLREAKEWINRKIKSN